MTKLSQFASKAAMIAVFNTRIQCASKCKPTYTRVTVYVNVFAAMHLSECKCQQISHIVLVVCVSFV